MKKLGFITSEDDPHLIDDDKLVFPDLEKRGFTVVPIVWDHFEKVNFESFDGLIFRSCWNYHKKYLDFLNFLDCLKKYKIPIYNSLEISQWNLNKRYLLDLSRNILVPKTKCLQPGESVTAESIQAIFQEWQADQIVVKPAISLNGHDTYLLSSRELSKVESIILDLLEDRSVLIQEFIPEIKTEGEISLIYFNKKFSHAVRKVPAENEFRVHYEYGGSRKATQPSDQALAYGDSVLNEVKENLLFSRVDLVESKRGPILIELEIVDPMLYLATQEIAAKNFAQAIAEAFA